MHSMIRRNKVTRGRLQVAGVANPRQRLAIVIVATVLDAVVEIIVADGEHRSCGVIATVGCEFSAEGEGVVADEVLPGGVLFSLGRRAADTRRSANIHQLGRQGRN